jgi:hypothetical protein
MSRRKATPTARSTGTGTGTGSCQRRRRCGQVEVLGLGVVVVDGRAPVQQRPARRHDDPRLAGAVRGDAVRVGVRRVRHRDGDLVAAGGAERQRERQEVRVVRGQYEDEPVGAGPLVRCGNLVAAVGAERGGGRVAVRGTQRQRGRRRGRHRGEDGRERGACGQQDAGQPAQGQPSGCGQQSLRVCETRSVLRLKWPQMLLLRYTARFVSPLRRRVTERLAPAKTSWFDRWVGVNTTARYVAVTSCHQVSIAARRM